MINIIWIKIINWVQNNQAKADVTFFLISSGLSFILSDIKIVLTISIVIAAIAGTMFLINLFNSIPARMHLLLLKLLSIALLLVVIASFFLMRKDFYFNSCGPQSAESFIAFLQPTMSGSVVKAEITIKNTTSEPLLLLADHDTRASMSDNTFGLATQTRTPPRGIKSYSQFLNGPALKEDFYTRIAAGQKIVITADFEPHIESKISGETNVTVTTTFLTLSNGKVVTVVASPCAVMKVNN